MQISSAGNSDTACYSVLIEMGFSLELLSSGDPAEPWIRATKDELTFNAGSPVEVLGLVAMHQARGDRWKPSDVEVDAYTKFDER